MKKECSFRRWWLAVLIFVGSFHFQLQSAQAYIDVGGVFLDEDLNPISAPLEFRLSLWGTYDVRPTDINGDGSLNTSALHYGGYQTTFTATPNEKGLYSFEIAPLQNFPVLNPFNSFVQLEFKFPGQPNTAYRIYDFLDDPPYQNVTRLLMDGNTVYYVGDAGPRTNWNSFTLDANSNAPAEVALQFGEILAETLKFSITSDRFDLSDDLNVSGSLTTSAGITSSGTINFQAANVGIGTATPQSALQVADGYYAQFSDNNVGAPPATDCDSDAERGRLSIDTQNNRLYICNGAVRGWDYSSLND